jgi:hypothetical protein
LLRLCFANNAEARAGSEEDKELLSRWETLLKEEIEYHATWVGGHDLENRAILHRGSRSTAEVDEQSYNLLTWYMAERAFACSEINSKGREDQILVVLDYSNYQSDMVPPMSIIKESIKRLQQIYPERAKKVFVLDPPLWLQIAYLVVSPFLAKETRDKVSGSLISRCGAYFLTKEIISHNRVKPPDLCGCWEEAKSEKDWRLCRRRASYPHHVR